VCVVGGTVSTVAGVITQEADILIEAHFGGVCNNKRVTTCQISCDVDCIVTQWSEPECVKDCETDKAVCDKTCGIGMKVYTPLTFTEALNKGKKCKDTEKRQPCYLSDACNTTCIAPKQPNTRKNICLLKCQDLAFSQECSENNFDNICGCPGNMIEQDGDCVQPNECRCTWNENMLGPRPTNMSAELAAGYVLQKDCNQCTCVSGQWSCSQFTCTQDCVWSSWSEYTPCNSTCDKGVQQLIRTIATPAQYGGAECQGPSMKYAVCWPSSQQCCDPNASYQSIHCQVTCHMVLNNQLPNSSCIGGCRCNTGYAYDETSRICVPYPTCRRCVYNGVDYDENKVYVDMNQCLLNKCTNGLITTTIMEVEILPPCDEIDSIVYNRGGDRSKHPTKCCYIATEKACRPEPRPLPSVLLKDGSLCVFKSNVTLPQCVGACPSTSVMDSSEFGPQVVKSLTSQVSVIDNRPVDMSILSDCTCCMPLQAQRLPRRVYACADGRFVSVALVQITKCGCKVTCKEKTASMLTSDLLP
jgi:hypothetical protein